ncbi:MAG: SAM-dependent DNA methyltransferase [Gordonia sp.]|uniref:class I SAM-dependent DNA methyltransferase n=1 Tax=Gordonia sp. (in: high G+C Gram-positive bacteria) TaxID=84139 RepID=UPI001D1D1087|nr:class I SAM-dependent DNA methyltransferase [Gordonia sp. (in: high G+C Gram-positive bacteria)]MCB1297338.1 SAM-dependent DNA methyltransferase [Gordonia sp. (in: high G+C Gram-positive bacteria)]HQV16756.1 class I SAM-dependent DNA methyltransferase [Gordonia sp. (in: high G+C Gram-positive bacteria)]
MSDSRRLVAKLVAGSNVLRDSGVNMYEYTEQLTYLLFLKMAEERATRPLNPERVVPENLSWHRLLGLSGDKLEDTYNHILRELANQPGVLGAIYRRAQNKISNPSHLKTLIVDYINKENWSAAGADVNGDAYEELLERSAGDTKSTAGQYFTPRPLIQAMVDVLRPTIDDTVIDPACGTGGFLLAAHSYVAKDAATFTPPQRDHLQNDFVTGVDIGATTSRLASMNLLLHGLGSITGDSLIENSDALLADPGRRWSMVLANPPFGKSSSTDIGGAGDDDAEIFRQDFVVTTSNKQLNFLQHIMTILDVNGRAGVVLPDNVLFEGGAGETLRRKLLTAYNFHTLLRLPTGIFYKPGVKANVLFFDRKPAAEQPWTQRLWIYDLRTNKHFTLKKHPMRRTDLDDFVEVYRPGEPHDARTESDRWKSFTYDELVARDKVNLDITWLRDESLEDADNLPSPDVIAREIVEDLTAALAEFEAVASALEAGATGTE